MDDRETHAEALARQIEDTAIDKLALEAGVASKTWTDLPVVCLAVGDYIELAGHRYLIHVAHRNRIVLAPAPPDTIHVAVTKDATGAQPAFMFTTQGEKVTFCPLNAGNACRVVNSDDGRGFQCKRPDCPLDTPGTTKTDRPTTKGSPHATR